MPPLANPHDLSALIGTVYDSALEEPQWQRLLDRLREIFPPICIAITGYDGAVGTPAHVQSGFDEVYVEKYVTEYALKNETAAVQMQQPVGSVFGDYLVPREEYLSYVFLKEWLAPQGLGATTGAILASNKGRFLALNAAYPFEVEDAVRSELEPLLHILVPHLIRAMEIARTIKLTRALADNLRGLLDNVIVPMLVTDGSGRYLFANAAGQRLLERGALFQVTYRGDLRLKSREETTRLRAQIAQMSDDICVSALQVKSDDGMLTLCVSPFRLGMTSGGALDNALYGTEERIAVFVGQRDEEPANVGLIQDVFALTRREAEVCAQLILGRSPAEIADNHGRSERTVRNQVQTIYDKIGVKKQTELIDTLSIFRSVGTLFEPNPALPA